jgi:hypothetical protein
MMESVGGDWHFICVTEALTMTSTSLNPHSNSPSDEGREFTTQLQKQQSDPDATDLGKPTPRHHLRPCSIAGVVPRRCKPTAHQRQPSVLELGHRRSQKSLFAPVSGMATQPRVHGAA